MALLYAFCSRIVVKKEWVQLDTVVWCYDQSPGKVLKLTLNNGVHEIVSTKRETSAPHAPVVASCAHRILN